MLYAFLGLAVGLAIGFFVSRYVFKKNLKKNPPINEKMIVQCLWRWDVNLTRLKSREL